MTCPSIWRTLCVTTLYTFQCVTLSVISPIANSFDDYLVHLVQLS